MKKYLGLALGLALMVPVCVKAQSWNGNGAVKEIVNDTGTGTTQFKAACMIGGKAKICPTSATAGYLGICVLKCGTSGSALIAYGGIVPVIVDGTTTADHYVTVSGTVAGDGSDTAASTFPTSGLIIGTVQTASSGAASTSLIDLNASVKGLTTSATQLGVVNAQTATYQALAGDFSGSKTITVASGTFTITLVASGSQPATGQSIIIINYGTGVVTVARSGQNINGGTTSITIPAGSASAPTGLYVVSDGTNYFAQTFGGGSTNTAIPAMSWVIWGNSYSSGSAAVATAANRGHSQGFVVSYPVTSTTVRFSIGTAAGASKGAIVGIYADATLTSAVCLSVTGNSGNASPLLDVNATGTKAFTWSTGSGVSGGVCTLNAGAYILVISTDSTALALANYGSVVGFQIMTDNNGSSTYFYRFGDATNAVGSGSNTGVTMGDISATTWGQASNANQFALVR